MSNLTLSEGQLFASRYRIERCIAMGGMGAVYEVTHLETERRRALKVMLPHLVQSHDLRERFRREAKVAAQIQSAYIVDVFDAGIDDATQMPFLVMELLHGEELGKRLARMGRFSFQETVGYLWQTALALDKTHRAHIVHRDLKPENLFLHTQDDAPARIKILDFGIAKLVADGGTHANATRSVGTPLYMAPEQFRSGSTVSPATDIYSLGMMAFTLLVGISYWHDEQRADQNVFAFAGLVMNGPVEAPSARALKRGVKLPAAFDIWFGQAASREPAQRFLSATAAIRGLASALGLSDPAEQGGTTTVPPSEKPQDAVVHAGTVMLADSGGSGVQKTEALPSSTPAPRVSASDGLGFSTGRSSGGLGARAERAPSLGNGLHVGDPDPTQNAPSGSKRRRLALFGALLALGAVGLLGVAAFLKGKPEPANAASEPPAAPAAVHSIPIPASGAMQQPVVEPQPEGINSTKVSVDAGGDAPATTANSASPPSKPAPQIPVSTPPAPVKKPSSAPVIHGRD